jgi:4-amino-4-deoxy-L-arabinose transferase-like glycosyltransferase
VAHLPARQADSATSIHSKAAALAASRWFLAAAVLIGLLLRIAWAERHGLSIEQEGAEYARIGQNLLAGKGFVGMFNNGVQLNFPPLYPFLIAAVSMITGNAEIAARSINVVLGALLVVPVFRICESVHGRSVAVAAASLVVLHPVLLAGAASTYSEPLYLTVVVYALMFLVYWVKERRLSSAVAVGALFGVAYLIRPEAFLLAGLFGGGGLILARFLKQRRETVRGSLALLGSFIVLAAPNIAFLTHETGHLRIEAKGTLAYAWGQRINQGMSYAESISGIGPDLSDQGVFMRPNLDVIRSTSYSTLDYVKFVLRALKKNVAPIVHTMTGETAIGSPLLFGLGVLGLFGTAWSRERWRVDGLVLIYAATFVLVLMTVQELWFRYFFGIFAMMLFWAAKGACELGSWGEDTVAQLGQSKAVARGVASSLKWAAVVLVLALSLGSIGSLDQFDESMKSARKDAGLWLAHQAGRPKRVMGFDLQVPYHADADLMLLPYADSALALRYIADRKPDYIVLIGGSPGGLPYTNQWFATGIPSPDAQLVYDQAKPGAEHIKIYRWLTSAAPTN